MKNYRVIIVFFVTMVTVSLTAVSCRKNKTSVEDEPKSITSKADPSVAVAKIKGSWTWDSTEYFEDQKKKYTYSPTSLKIHTVIPAVTICTTTSNFSLNFTNVPAHNKSNGSGYLNTYAEGGVNSENADVEVKLRNVYDVRNQYQQIPGMVDTTVTWSWVIFPYENSEKLYLHAYGSFNPRHAGTTYIGYVIFSPSYFTIETISETVLVLSVIQVKGATTERIGNYYFHR